MCGGAFSVIATTFAARSSGTGGLPGGRVLSRRTPSTPSAMNRSCQRQTVVFAVPMAAKIAFVPKPSAVSSTIQHRQTCFCGVLQSVAMASRRRRSASSRVMVTRARPAGRGAGMPSAAEARCRTGAQHPPRARRLRRLQHDSRLESVRLGARSRRPRNHLQPCDTARAIGRQKLETFLQSSSPIHRQTTAKCIK